MTLAEIIEALQQRTASAMADRAEYEAEEARWKAEKAKVELETARMIWRKQEEYFDAMLAKLAEADGEKPVRH